MSLPAHFVNNQHRRLHSWRPSTGALSAALDTTCYTAVRQLSHLVDRGQWDSVHGEGKCTGWDIQPRTSSDKLFLRNLLISKSDINEQSLSPVLRHGSSGHIVRASLWQASLVWGQYSSQ
jgi:hypothetical protein